MSVTRKPPSTLPLFASEDAVLLSEAAVAEARRLLVLMLLRAAGRPAMQEESHDEREDPSVPPRA